MIQIVAVAAIGGLAYVAWSSFKRHMEEIERREKLDNEDRAVLPELEKDPATGRYRPKDK